MASLPSELRIGHLRFRVVEDDAEISEHAVRDRGGDYAGWSHTATQTIALGTKAVRHGNRALGEDYRRETLLHEVLHCCLRVAGCDPDQDAAGKLEDVEERAVSAMSGPLLAAFRDNPELLAYLCDAGADPE